jgi:hypothetical protein
MDDKSLRRGQGDQRIRIFSVFLFVFFMATAIFRSTTSDWRTERIRHLNELQSHKNELLAQYSKTVDSLKTVAEQLGDKYSYADAYQTRYTLIPLFFPLREIGVVKDLGVIGQFLDQAQKNWQQNNCQPPEAQWIARRQYGQHPLENKGAVDLKSLGKAVLAFIGHFIWCAMFMPLFLMGRLLYREKLSVRILAKALVPHLWWLITCSALWPFCAALHAERDPRTTTRFFWLRLRYIWQQRRLFITVAEKEELLHSAGTAEENIQAIFERVEYAAACATGQAQRLAFVACLSALAPISLSGQLAMAIAQTPVTVTAKPSEDKPQLTIKGHFVNGLILRPHNGKAPSGTITINLVRMDATVKHGKWQLRLIADAQAPILVSTASIGYDMDPRLQLAMGRNLALSTRLVPSSKNTPFAVTPLENLLLPGTDNSVEISGHWKVFDYFTGLYNGSGDLKDNNSELDVGGHLGMTLSGVKLRYTRQTGQQPSGNRTFIAYDAETNLGPITLGGLFVERPDLSSEGFAAKVLIRAGPNTIATLAEQKSSSGHSVRHLDLGFNRQINRMTTALFHTVFGSNASPQFVLRLQSTF